MQLACPNCGEPVVADNINIQQMVAVCSACDTVFEFERPQPKSKRRKVKQPEHLTLREDSDTLQMRFRTNFRLDKNEAFLTGAITSFFLTFVTVLLASQYVAGDVPLLIPAAFSLVTLGMYYWLALIVWNITQIEADDDEITVTRKPLPDFLYHTRHINLSGVVAIRSEETAVSKKEAYDTPRYRVWAEREDGSQQIIVTDVIEEYAYFITQTLDQRLNEALEDISHLTDEAYINETAPDLTDFKRRQNR